MNYGGGPGGACSHYLATIFVTCARLIISILWVYNTYIDFDRSPSDFGAMFFFMI